MPKGPLVYNIGGIGASAKVIEGTVELATTENTDDLSLVVLDSDGNTPWWGYNSAAPGAIRASWLSASVSWNRYTRSSAAILESSGSRITRTGSLYIRVADEDPKYSGNSHLGSVCILSSGVVAYAQPVIYYDYPLTSSTDYSVNPAHVTGDASVALARLPETPLTAAHSSARQAISAGYAVDFIDSEGQFYTYIPSSISIRNSEYHTTWLSGSSQSSGALAAQIGRYVLIPDCGSASNYSLNESCIKLLSDIPFTATPPVVGGAVLLTSKDDNEDFTILTRIGGRSLPPELSGRVEQPRLIVNASGDCSASKVASLLVDLPKTQDNVSAFIGNGGSVVVPGEVIPGSLNVSALLYRDLRYELNLYLSQTNESSIYTASGRNIHGSYMWYYSKSEKGSSSYLWSSSSEHFNVNGRYPLFDLDKLPIVFSRSATVLDMAYEPYPGSPWLTGTAHLAPTNTDASVAILPETIWITSDSRVEENGVSYTEQGWEKRRNIELDLSASLIDSSSNQQDIFNSRSDFDQRIESIIPLPSENTINLSGAYAQATMLGVLKDLEDINNGNKFTVASVHVKYPECPAGRASYMRIISETRGSADWEYSSGSVLSSIVHSFSPVISSHISETLTPLELPGYSYDLVTASEFPEVYEPTNSVVELSKLRKKNLIGHSNVYFAITTPHMRMYLSGYTLTQTGSWRSSSNNLSAVSHHEMWGNYTECDYRQDSFAGMGIVGMECICVGGNHTSLNGSSSSINASYSAHVHYIPQLLSVFCSSSSNNWVATTYIAGVQEDEGYTDSYMYGIQVQIGSSARLRSSSYVTSLPAEPDSADDRVDVVFDHVLPKLVSEFSLPVTSIYRPRDIPKLVGDVPYTPEIMDNMQSWVLSRVSDLMSSASNYSPPFEGHIDPPPESIEPSNDRLHYYASNAHFVSRVSCYVSGDPSRGGKIPYELEVGSDYFSIRGDFRF